MRSMCWLGIIPLTLVAACDTPTQPARSITPRGVGAPNAVVVQNDKVQSVAFAISDCTGAVIAVDATFHFVTAFTISSSGTYHLMEHTNATAKGTDPATGTDYVVNQTENLELNLAAGGEDTSMLHFNLISRGSAPNEVLQANLHTTITPNGEITSSVDNFSIKCD